MEDAAVLPPASSLAKPGLRERRVPEAASAHDRFVLPAAFRNPHSCETLLRSQLWSQSLSQRFTPAKNVRLDLSQRHTEFPGDLLIRQTFEVIKHQRDALSG